MRKLFQIFRKYRKIELFPRQLERYGEIHVTLQFLAVSGQDNRFFFQKSIFRLCLGVRLYQILDIYRFSFDQERGTNKETYRQTNIK